MKGTAYSGSSRPITLVFAGDMGLEGVEAWLRVGADIRGDLHGGRDELLAYGGVEGIVKFIIAVGAACGGGGGGVNLTAVVLGAGGVNLGILLDARFGGGGAGGIPATKFGGGGAGGMEVEGGGGGAMGIPEKFGGGGGVGMGWVLMMSADVGSGGGGGGTGGGGA